MKTLTLSLVTALALPAAALAAQPVAAPLRAAPQVARVQTRADAVQHVRTMFTRLDVNRDGFLTQDEVQAARAQFGGRMHANRGLRGAQAGAAAFERMDLNRDGAITRAEWDAHVAQRQQRVAAFAQSRGNRWGGNMRGGGMGGRMFQMADSNRDNRVSFAEAQAAALQRFDRADLNRDGTLTPQERQQSRQMMRGQRQRG